MVLPRYTNSALIWLDWVAFSGSVGPSWGLPSYGDTVLVSDEEAVADGHFHVRPAHRSALRWLLRAVWAAGVWGSEVYTAKNTLAALGSWER
jgi:hypothetical protein